MNNLNYVQAGKDKLPYKFTRRATMQFEAETGYALSNLPDNMTQSESVNLDVTLVKCALLAGQKLTKGTKTFTNDDVLDLDEQYDIIAEVLKIITEPDETEKK